MKIATIGTGNIARSLGILRAEQGHEVFFGCRDSEKGRSIADAGNGTQGGTNDEAAFGNVIFYSIQDVMPSTVFSSTEVLSGKVLIDCNNRKIPEGYAI